DLPLYTLRNLATGQVRKTSDPGRALLSGKWKDIGKFKGPVLRGLAARAPYFHNGLAADLEAVVDFYETRFSIGLTARQNADLGAFLEALGEPLPPAPRPVRCGRRPCGPDAAPARPVRRGHGTDRRPAAARRGDRCGRLHRPRRRRPRPR